MNSFFHSTAKIHFLQRESPGLHVRGVEKGFVFSQPGNSARPQDQADFCVECSHPDTKVNAAWFRGGWSDAQTAAWRSVEKGEVIEAQAHPQDASGSGASLYVPVALAPGQSVKIVIRMSWYVPFSDVYFGGQHSCCDGAKCDPNPEDFHQPWYAGHFSGIEEIRRYWRHQYDRLRLESEKFSQALHDTDMPPEMIEAVSANLSILKSPTMLRQKDGRIWAYEGCSDTTGCCEGSCTHVWNYAQAVAHLFPALERTMRETEFGPSQSDSGHQTFRAALPIGPQEGFWAGVDAAADGQLGGIMKVYRDWRISGDTEWLRRLWPKVRQSLDYCIRTWDPEHRGILVEPHHNTYDIEFWGPNGMCCSHYLGALKAAALMAPACGDSPLLYEELSSKGRTFVETELWNGEYFIQQVRTEGLQSPPPHQRRGVVWTEYSPEALELLKKEGPKYQYGDGCLAEGVVGAWLAAMCGLPDILDPDKVRQHLLSVIRHNFRETLWDHANPQRPGYALDRDGGLILCTWPRGGALTFPFPYSNEVWTGFEYHVAGHLMLLGESDPARKIVRTARQRHDGVRRNPFNEYECGSWYARALTSYGLLRAYSGARYDAIEKVLHMAPTQTGDFRCFLSTATGYGVVGVKNGKPYFDLRGGSVEIRKIELSA
ncbi:GH116 family glycosyl hydrolase [Kamptonema cortianum]|nr:GH116 family glycosyl hydrolase [Kamptonema cortianum]